MVWDVSFSVAEVSLDRGLVVGEDVAVQPQQRLRLLGHLLAWCLSLKLLALVRLVDDAGLVLRFRCALWEC